MHAPEVTRIEIRITRCLAIASLIISLDFLTDLKSQGSPQKSVRSAAWTRPRRKLRQSADKDQSCRPICRFGNRI